MLAEKSLKNDNTVPHSDKIGVSQRTSVDMWDRLSYGPFRVLKTWGILSNSVARIFKFSASDSALIQCASWSDLDF